MNLAAYLAAAADRHGTRPAVTDVRSGRALPYGRVAAEADRVARFLRAHGVARGQRIGLLAPNGLAYVPATFGLLEAGACVVPLAASLTGAETARAVDEVEVHACLCWPQATQLGRAAAATLGGGECDGFRLVWLHRDAAGPAELGGLDPAFVRFTSGTTAVRKGVVLSHEATAARVEAADAILRLSPDDRILWVLPLAYHFAATIVAYVRAGAHVLLGADAPHAMADALARTRPTVLYASPFHFVRLGHLPPAAAVEGVRLALSTSAPIGLAAIERFEAAYGIPLGQAYGIIEAGLPCINDRTGGAPATSVGPAVPGYEVAVWAEAGTPAPVGATGDVVVRGPGLFSAYYAPWAPREAVTRDGWFRTGDAGRLDAQGALSLEGRTTAVIVVAGFKFFPEEVEEHLNRCPGVRESRVFGRPHPRLGEVACAEVVLEPGGPDAAALGRYCARGLSAYKVPLEFTVVDAIPRTGGGKILRGGPAPPAPTRW